MKKVQRSVWIAVGVMFSVWVVGWIAIVLFIPSWEQRGQFGDMFGSVNALFSSFALVGVIAAILIQREELALQRKELELTRTELARSTEAQGDTADSMRLQVDLLLSTARINALNSMITVIENSILRTESSIHLSQTEEESVHHQKKRDEEFTKRNKLFNELEYLTGRLSARTSESSL